MFIVFIYLKQASLTMANIHNRWLSCRSVLALDKVEREDVLTV